MENEQSQGDAQEDSQEMGNMDPQQLFQMVGQGLTRIVDGLGQSGAPKEILAPFEAALEAYTAGFQAIQGGGKQVGGAAPMEAGAAETAPSGSMRMRG